MALRLLGAAVGSLFSPPSEGSRLSTTIALSRCLSAYTLHTQANHIPRHALHPRLWATLKVCNKSLSMLLYHKLRQVEGVARPNNTTAGKQRQGAKVPATFDCRTTKHDRGANTVSQHTRHSIQVAAEHLLFQLLEACSAQPHEVSLLLHGQLHILSCCNPSVRVLPALNVATPAEHEIPHVGNRTHITPVLMQHETPHVGIRTHNTPVLMQHEKGAALRRACVF